MKQVDVLIPYGNETPWRDRALEYTRTWYGTVLEDARVLIGRREGPWSKAEAVAAALAESRAPVVVIADADCITPGLAEAVRAVQAGVAWAMPHLKVYRMSPGATQAVYEGIAPGSLTGRNVNLDQSPYKGYEGGGITVLRREVYLNCPLDPAFVGWGQEDEAWALALNGLHGAPWRGSAPLYHLWHEKPPRLSRYAGSAASVARLARYKESTVSGEWNEVLGKARKHALMSASRGKVAI